MKEFINADNAATTKLDVDAFEAMKPFLLEEYANPSQPYLFARFAKNALKRSRAQIAECIGALPEEIYFTSGGTESNNWVIKSSALSDSRKRPMITSQIEHHALLNACTSIERLGYPVEYLPVNSNGEVIPETLERMMDDRIRLVSVMFSNNEIGTIQPVDQLAKIAHSYGALFHTDAVQALGHLKLNVAELDVDFLSASAHKFNGPKGVGFLYIKKGTQLPPYSDGGAQEFGLRAGTENVAGVVGMAVALQKNCVRIEDNARRLYELERTMIGILNKYNVDYIHNGGINRTPGNLSFSFKHVNGETLLHRLDLMGICVSTGSACDSVNTNISHVLRAIALDDEYANGTIRISLGRDNTEEQVIRIAESIVKILKSQAATI